MKKGLEDFCKC